MVDLRSFEGRESRPNRSPSSNNSVVVAQLGSSHPRIGTGRRLVDAVEAPIHPKEEVVGWLRRGQQ